jgi:hypothetical protein
VSCRRFPFRKQGAFLIKDGEDVRRLGSTEPLKVMDSVSGHKYHWPGEDSVFLDAPTLMWEIPDFDVRFDHTLWLALPRSEKLGRERAPIGTIADPVERGDYHANCR